MNTHTRNQKGFTLVELLIVVIILGILAAVVIPQFNSAATESKEAALASNLATIRQAVEMYKVQHNDVFPTADIINQLTSETDVAGTVAGGAAYGPYLRNSFPNNPISSINVVVVTATGTLTAPTASAGWKYDSSTGEFRVDDNGTTLSGTPYFDL
jgi:general secretion pathway protein G